MTSNDDEPEAAKTVPQQTEPGRSYTLCAVSGCCPTVHVNDNDNTVTIKDDFGGTVRLTKKEWLDAVERVKL